MMIVWLVVILFVIALLFRIFPLWRKRYFGVDVYYFLLCAEEFKKHKKIPIVLPQYYLMEQREQWYPPMFSIFLTIIPRKILGKCHWLLSPLIDSIINLIAFILIYWVTNNMWLAFMGGMVYAVNSTTIADCFSLTSRQLGSLFLAITLLSLFGYGYWHEYWLLGVSLLSGTVLLMTHKMSTQLLWFILPMMSLIFWDWIYVVIGVGIILVALITTGGFYRKIWKAHWDILSFWNRNWVNLGGHQVYDSPLYKDESKTRIYFKKGKKGFVSNIRQFGINIFALTLIYSLMNYNALVLFDRQMLWWTLLTYILAILTTFIPKLRIFGEGVKYLKLAVLPIVYLTIRSLSLGTHNDMLIGFCFIASIFIYLFIIGKYTSSAKSKLESAEFKQLITYVKDSKDIKRISCLPYDMVDSIVYHCRRKVLWGTHNYSFKDVEKYFPVLKKPYEYFVKKHRISHTIIDINYVEPSVLKYQLKDRIFVSGNYEVFRA